MVKHVYMVLAAILLLASPAWAQMSGTAPFMGPFSFSPTGPYKAGRYYGPVAINAVAGVALAAANTIYAVPFWVPATSLAMSLNFDVTSANSAAWNARMGIYTDSGNWSPANLVPNSDAGTIAIAANATGAQTASLNGGSGVSLAGPAWYWLAFNASATGASVSMLSSNYAGAQRFFGDSVATGIFSSVTSNGFSMSETFGAMPTTLGSATVYRNAAIPYIEVGF